MQFSLSEDQRGLLATVRKATQKEFKPNAARYYDGTFPHENLTKLAQLGVTGMAVPEEYGGLGSGILDRALVLEELAKGCYPTAMMMLGELGVQASIIADFAPEALKRRILPKIASGDCVLAICITEPDAGSDVGAAKTNADVRDNSVVLNGVKTLISRADVADVFLVFTRVNRVPGGKGIGCLILEKGVQGLSASGKYHTMGGEMLSEVIFDDCRVPLENLVVANDGTKKLFNAFNMQRCFNSAICLGLAEAAFNESVRYMRDRSAFGHPIGEYQGLRWKLVNMYKEIEAARGLLYRACVSGNPYPNPLEAALAKIHCNEMAVSVANDAVSMHGGFGYCDEFLVSRIYRSAKFGGSGGGTPDLLRNMVAKGLMDRFDPSDDFIGLGTF